ncbi:MAG: IS91 family transposase [Caldilineaceae bacterium]
MILTSLVDVATVKPSVEIADIFRLHFNEYLQTHHCTPEEFAAAKAITKCRTAAMGGHVRSCDSCGHLQIVYNSCNNRNCPKCGAFEKAQWLANQAARLIPVPHFQVVFTVDHLVNDLAYVNPQPIYDLLFATANRALKEFAQRYLGGKVGVTAVLHTWGQTMQHHVHLHCMVTGGALVSTATGDVWRSANSGFLFPVVELSAAFRDAFCKGLTRLAKRGVLRFVGLCPDVDVAKLAQKMQAKKWEVFIGAPPKEAAVENLLGYFSRYVYRSAISNSRIRKLEDGQVTFALFNNKERDAEGQGAKRVMTLCAVEFIRRFLRHVLPFQYKRVRHFGLYAGSKRRLQTVRMLVGVMVESTQDTPPKLEMGEWLTSLGLEDAMRCPACATGTMRVGDAFAPLGFLQLWLLLWLGVPILGQEAA